MQSSGLSLPKFLLARKNPRKLYCEALTSCESRPRTPPRSAVRLFSWIRNTPASFILLLQMTVFRHKSSHRCKRNIISFKHVATALCCDLNTPLSFILLLFTFREFYFVTELKNKIYGTFAHVLNVYILQYITNVLKVPKIFVNVIWF